MGKMAKNISKKGKNIKVEKPLKCGAERDAVS